MHIVLAMAGHSRRFKQAGYEGPKAFLDIDGRPMISHVVDMFSSNDVHFHFVISSDQVRERPSIEKDLHALANKSQVYVIAPHEKGPTFSALQATGVPSNAEVIVSYCDFFVDWDFQGFLAHARTSDFAIPSFSGFHPASFGHTYYAYMRAEGDQVLELREKKSFTEQRHLEPASVGIYYFSSAAIFKKYAEQLLATPQSELPEAYVSLLANPMITDGLKVVLHPVERFVCWGTPGDYEQYLFWLQNYKNTLNEQNIRSEMARVLGPKPSLSRVNVVPMAGSGARFLQEGYRAPKPFIEVSEKPMVKEAALSFPPADSWVFVAQQKHLKRYPIRRELKRTFEQCHFVPLQHETGGQAETCIAAESAVPPQAQLMIHSCDYKVWFNAQRWLQVLEDSNIDAALWTVQLGSQLFKNANAFAYCSLAAGAKANQVATVSQIVEKQAISATPEKDAMAMGSFWFRRASDFFESAKEMIRQGTRVNNEYYVATAMNALIRNGKRVVSFPIDQWISFGDPFELKVFEFWQAHFKARGVSMPSAGFSDSGLGT